MFYREAGDFKTSYRADSQTFPIRLDRIGYFAALAVAYGVVPFVIGDAIKIALAIIIGFPLKKRLDRAGFLK